MAVLSDDDRKRIWRGLMRYWSSLNETVAVDKAELKAAVDATDQWVDDNAAAFNAALPAPFRTGATQAQKSALLVAVASARFSPELLKKIFGDVD